MKLKKLASITALLLATLTAARAQTNTLGGWSFDNLPLGANSSPAAAINSGTASVAGLSTATVVGLPGSSTGSVVGTNVWKVTGGWSTNSPIGSQGAQFAVSTIGDYQVQVSFDIYATTNAEGLLQVQYTPNGTLWLNANITSAGSLGVLATNINPTNGIVVGSYLILTNSSGPGAWNNGVTINLSGVSWADNNPNFAIRIVNAARNTNCVDTTGALYNSAIGGDFWALDNVNITAVSFDTAVDWTFDGVGTSKHVNNPGAAISNTVATASCFGFGTPTSPLVSSTFSPNYSTNDADITANGLPFSSTGSAGQNVWRLRGQPGNGWLSTLPIGSQGAEFDVDTRNYTNIILTFDLYFTTQGEAKMCVLYTTDGWATTNVANSLVNPAWPQFVMTNTPSFTSKNLNQAGNATYSTSTVNGTLFFQTYGSTFFNNFIVDFTGVPGVANNSQFGFRVVNAATGADCVNYLYQPYNNNSGNSRIDNVAVNGKFNGAFAPSINNSPSATVDNPFTNTFANSPGWSANISSVYYNGFLLPKAAYTVTSSNIVFNPAQSANVIGVAGTNYITIYASGYTVAKVTQVVSPGVFSKLSYAQLSGPTASGGTLTVNPSFTCLDQYGNATEVTHPNMQVVATVSNSPATWVLGGSVTQAIYNGSCTFTDLTASLIAPSSTPIYNAAIKFTVTSGPISVTNSTSFVIGAPPVGFTQGNLAALQFDTAAANTTFSVVEINPSAVGQTNPVNIVPITASGPNALRMGGGGAGHLALSDDGTFLVFGAFDDNSSATPDETFNQNRAVGTLNYTNKFVKTGQYYSVSYGGSAVRAACSPDNVNYLIDDKGGLFAWNTSYNTNYSLYEENNYCTRSFGGAAYVLTQKVQTSPAGFPLSQTFYWYANASGGLDYLDAASGGSDAPVTSESQLPPTDPNAVDFYMISTNGTTNAASFGILYIIDQSSGNNGSSCVITKYANPNPVDPTGLSVWTQLGNPWTNSDNAVSLFATTNAAGGVYLYYANGKGGVGNSIIRLTDQSIMGNLNILSTNNIYTAPGNTSIAGITFVPNPATTPYANVPAVPPILTPSTAAYPSSTSFTNAMPQDDGIWRSNITSITVNGTLLPPAAYATNSAGYIVFYPQLSGGLLTVAGPQNIIINAAGYSADSFVQPVIGPATRLVMPVEPSLANSAGQLFITPPVVYIEDAYGNVDTSNNVAVVAATIGATGTGPLTGATTATAVNGVATFGALVLPATAQTNLVLTYTNRTLTSLIDTNKIHVVGGASKLAISGSPTTLVGVGSIFAVQPVVLVEDTVGNVVFTNNVSVVTAKVGTGTGSLNGTLTATAVNGVATFSGLAAPTVAQTGLKLAYTNPSTTSITDSVSVTVTAGAATQMLITTQPTNIVGAGATFGLPPVVSIVDQYSNVVKTATATNIVALIGTGSGTLSGTITNATVAGVATFSGLRAPTVLQTNLTLVFTNCAFANVTNIANITVVPGTPSQMFMITEPSSSVLAGTAFAVQPALNVADAYGNLCTNNSSLVVTATVGTGTGPLTGITTATNLNGVVTFSGLGAPLQPQAGLELTFTAGGVSNAVDVTSITVSTIPTAITLPASIVYAENATLNGSVNPNGLSTIFWFKYGLTTNYGGTTLIIPVTTGFTAVPASTLLTGLLPGTVYHYQLVATNSAGLTNGTDISFTTLNLGGTLSGGQFNYIFTNVTGGNYLILSTNILRGPESTWPAIGSAVEAPAGSGQYIMTNQIIPTNSAAFFGWKTSGP